jgi:hypothetical protein
LTPHDTRACGPLATQIWRQEIGGMVVGAARANKQEAARTWISLAILILFDGVRDEDKLSSGAFVIRNCDYFLKYFLFINILK